MYYAYSRSGYLRLVALALLTIIGLLPGNLVAQNRPRDRFEDRSHSGDSPFRFKLRASVSRANNSYLYNYTLEQVDAGPRSYQRLSSFALVFPCGEAGYRSVRSLKSDGWSVDRDGYFSEPALRGQDSWGLRFSPTFQITPNGDGTTNGDRNFNFTFVSSCAPVQGEWIATGDQVDDQGKVDVPCGCNETSAQDNRNDREQRDRDQYDREPDRNDRYNDRDRDNSNRRDRDNPDRNSDNQDRNDRYSNRDRNSGNQYPDDQSGRITVTRQEIIISPDTTLKLRMESRLTSATAKIGDRFKATLVNDVMADRVRVLPAGCKIEGRITSVVPAQRGSKSGSIAIDFDRLILPSGRAVKVVGELTSLDNAERRQIDSEGHVQGSSTKRSVVFIGGGAAGGAAIGAIAGGGKGAGIGAAVGAGIGVLGVLLARGQEAVVEPGTEFGLLLTQPLRIPNAGLNSKSSVTTDRRDNRNDRNEDRVERIDDRNDANSSSNSSSNAPVFTASDYRTVYSDGDTIYRAQVKLKELGYLRSAPSSRINATTRRILIRYQTDNRLRATGRIDYPTAVTLGIVSAK